MNPLLGINRESLAKLTTTQVLESLTHDKTSVESINRLACFLVTNLNLSTVSKEVSNQCDLTQIVSYLKAAIRNPETINFLRNKNIPNEERNKKLREYILACMILLNSHRPFIRDENSNAFARTISKARVDDSDEGSYAGLVFGMKNDFSSQTFFGVAFHEIWHNVMRLDLKVEGENLSINIDDNDFIKGFIPIRDINSSIVEELTCDWTALLMYRVLSNGDRELFNELTKHLFVEALKPDDCNKRVHLDQDSITLTGQDGARAISHDLIQQAKQAGFDLYDLTPLIHQSLIRAVESYECNKVRKITSLKDFVNKFVGILNEDLRGNGLTVQVEETLHSIDDSHRTKMKEVIEGLLEKDDPSFLANNTAVREKLIRARLSNLGIVPRIIIKSK